MSFDQSMDSAESDFKLAAWWVRVQRNELESTDRVVRVEARSMNVLVCLARHAPDVVSKQQLHDEVWADAPFVGDDAVSHAIWELRKAFGDSAKQPAFIQTIARRGYRLLPDITRPSGSPVPMEGARIDHYDIGEELGRGSMGVVFAATDRRLGRPVAIKFLAPELTRDVKACQRFVREARLAASLEHPNLATVHEVGETSQGHRYLVMAYYAGGSLKERLARGPIPVDEVVRLGRQLALGLAAAHERDIVHRDIKPANLLLDAHGTLKIADFGIAKLLGGSDLTRTGAALGTPAYKSPEQSRGEGVDARTDIWSAGVVLFEMLTGRRPFDGEYEQAVVHAILSRRPEIREDALGRPVPKPLRQTVARALLKDPENRFQTAAAFGEALAAVAEGEPPPVRPGRRLVKTAGLAVAGLMVLGGWLWSQAPESEPVAVSEVVATPLEVVPGETAMAHLTFGNRAWLKGNTSENLKQAHDSFEKALVASPGWGKASAHLAVLLIDRYELQRQKADLDRAQGLVETLVRDHPSEPLGFVAQARLARMERRFQDAERLLMRALELQGSDCEPSDSCGLIYSWLAEARWGLGNDAEAFQTLDVCEKGPHGATRIRCTLKRAGFHGDRSRAHKAIEFYLQVLDLDPRQTTALGDLGKVYLDAGQYSTARIYLERQILETADPGPRLNLGHVYYYSEYEGHFREAIKVYRYARAGYRRLGITNPAPALSLGDAYLELGEHAAARRLLDEALKALDQLCSAEIPDPYRCGQRAVCLAKLGRVDEALEGINTLLVAEPRSKRLRVFQARIFAQAEEREALFFAVAKGVADGIDPGKFLDDAAFIPFRDDPDYHALLANGVPANILDRDPITDSGPGS